MKVQLDTYLLYLIWAEAIRYSKNLNQNIYGEKTVKFKGLFQQMAILPPKYLSNNIIS
jgi:hypothetical protein